MMVRLHRHPVTPCAACKVPVVDSAGVEAYGHPGYDFAACGVACGLSIVARYEALGWEVYWSEHADLDCEGLPDSHTKYAARWSWALMREGDTMRITAYGPRGQVSPPRVHKIPTWDLLSFLLWYHESPSKVAGLCQVAPGV